MMRISNPGVQSGRRATLVLPLVCLLGCAQSAVLRGRIAGLSQDVENAEKNGAMRCAPRELALAKSHLRFASTELDQGQLSAAEAHLGVAEPNAHAALDQSPPDRCAERQIIETRPPPDPDTDGDHIPDSRDQCILEPEDVDGYLDQDGCPDPDNDSDGIPDAVDKCPNQPEDYDGFQDEDGCPDPDNDGDTVLDVDDFCPNTPGQPGGAKPGCPGLVVVTAKEIRITQQIHFEFNKATIRSESFPILDAVAAGLDEQPDDDPRDPGPHRQRGQRPLQPEALAIARRFGAHVLGQPRHRRGASEVRGLRFDATGRPEHDRRESGAQPARAVHSDRGSPPVKSPRARVFLVSDVPAVAP